MQVLPPVETNPFLFVVLLMGLTNTGTAVSADGPVVWQPVIEGKMATVSVAKALFEQKAGNYFLAGVRVTNKTDRELGVDLRSRRYCVRINQWSAIDTAERGIINEQRQIRSAFTAKDEASLVAAFSDAKLVRIPAEKSVEYYCPFIGEDKGSTRAALEKLTTNFVILSMDGELRVTNGEQSESLRCGEPGEADVSIARPVSWLKVPFGSHIVSDDSAAATGKSPDSSTVVEVRLTPAGQSGWMISFFPDGRVNAQFGSGEGDAVLLPKGSVDFKSLLKAAYRLKSEKRREEASTIWVSFKDESQTAFSLTDDTLFRFLIDSFQDHWKPDLAVIGREEEFLRDHPIFVDEDPQQAKTEEESQDSNVKKLLNEKLSIYREIASQTTRLSKTGGVSPDQVYAANQAVYQAELELCDTNQERVAVLEKMLVAAKDLEKSVARAAKAGVLTASAVLTAQLRRLDAEIALERAKVH